MLVTSGHSKYLQEVFVTSNQFISFAMLLQGAEALSRARVIDVDMTFACTREDINMIKATVFDNSFRRTVTVARAWVKGQCHEIYKRFKNYLCVTYKKYVGRPLLFGALRWARETNGSVGSSPLNKIVGIRVDMDIGQVMGIRMFALEMEPKIGQDWEEACAMLLVICTVHFARNVTQTGFSPSTKSLMRSLTNARTPEVYDVVLNDLRQTQDTYRDSGGSVKTVGDWVDRFSSRWVRAGLSPAFTRIPSLLHADIRPRNQRDRVK